MADRFGRLLSPRDFASGWFILGTSLPPKIAIAKHARKTRGTARNGAELVIRAARKRVLNEKPLTRATPSVSRDHGAHLLLDVEDN